jgi:hypothetical protein
LSIDLSVPSAPLLDGVLLNTNGTNNDGRDVVGGIDPSGGDFNMFSLTQADAQTLLVSSTTVTGGDTQTGTGLVRVLDIGAPGNLSELRVLQIPGAVHLIGLAIQGNRALAVASSVAGTISSPTKMRGAQRERRARDPRYQRPTQPATDRDAHLESGLARRHAARVLR